VTRALAVVLLAAVPAAAFAQRAGPPSVSADSPAAVMSRDNEGRVTIRATRIAEAPMLDGRVDDPVYRTVPALGDFLQQEPDEGAPATERTEVWILFDSRAVYVAGRCWDSHPESEVANEMRRDGQGILDNESVGVTFDTFFDHRNGYLFQISLAGGLFDGYITDERDMNRDWNTVWDARTARFDQGWTFEMAVPFKSLRFRDGQQVWGVNVRRIVRWKNEMASVSQLPAALGRRAMNKLSASATLVGLEPPQARRTLEVKPYAIGGVSTDHADLAAARTVNANAGGDLKVGVTDGLTADVTYNTDFAQVEEDEQQVNLTRFSTLFPEKREFFLEGQGIFSFGGVQGPPRSGGGGGGGSGTPNRTDVPVVFFSRRIGLANGTAVPIDVGGRVTGKAGAYSIGLLDIRTSAEDSIDVPPTNFTVVRVKRDVLRRSAVGVIYTNRSIAEDGTGRNQAFGVDGVFGFFQNLNVNTYVAKSDTPGWSSHDWSYRAQLDYNADRYGLQIERLSVDPQFNPDVGFLARTAFRRNSGYARFSPRPASIRSVRKFNWDLNIDYITDPDGRLESRALVGGFRTEFENGDSAGVQYEDSYERLDEPFDLPGGIAVPPGGYAFPNVKATYQFGPQRRMSGVVNLERGRFYDGTRTAVSTGRGRVEITPQLSIEPGLTVNWIDVAAGSYTSILITTRASFTVSPRMATSALLQYNSDAGTVNTSVRFRWEYQPGSDLFVVYTDNRDTTGSGFPALESRGFVVKITRLFRM
jgi:hypothetical protein